MAVMWRSDAKLPQGIIFGLGNPLLDLMAEIDKDFLAKYELGANDAVLGQPKYQDLEQELRTKYEIKYIAGGSVQNTMRITQWLLNFQPGVCTFMGCIGNDDLGNRMKEEAKKDGIDCAYLIDDSEKTGYCCVLITDGGKNRSLVAFLGAANNMKTDHLLKNWDLVERAQLFYVSGFHITVCPLAMLEIAAHAAKFEEKRFALNLSAPFISKLYTKDLFKIMPYVDILFGNEDEASAYAEVKNWDSNDLRSIVALMVKDERINTKKERIVIITQGHNPVLVGSTNFADVKEFPVQQLAPEQVVDTNGAGDAFVAGFLSQYVQKMELQKCIDAGTYAAQQIIQQSGCSYPKNEPQL